MANYYQKVWDAGASRWCYYVGSSIDDSPASEDTTPNWVGPISQHCVLRVEETGGGGGGASSLQDAYEGGEEIDATASSSTTLPVAITTTASSGSVLDLSVSSTGRGSGDEPELLTLRSPSTFQPHPLVRLGDNGGDKMTIWADGLRGDTNLLLQPGTSYHTSINGGTDAGNVNVRSGNGGNVNIQAGIADDNGGAVNVGFDSATSEVNIGNPGRPVTIHGDLTATLGADNVTYDPGELPLDDDNVQDALTTAISFLLQLSDDLGDKAAALHASQHAAFGTDPIPPSSVFETESTAITIGTDIDDGDEEPFLAHNRCIRTFADTTVTVTVGEGEHGQVVEIIQSGDGQVTVEADDGVVLLIAETFRHSGDVARTAEPYSPMILRWMVSGAVVVYGDLEPAA